MVEGRKRALVNSKLDAAHKLIDEGTPRKDEAEIMKISVATLYRYFPGNNDYNYIEERDKALKMVEKGKLVDVYPEYSNVVRKQKT